MRLMHWSKVVPTHAGLLSVEEVKALAVGAVAELGSTETAEWGIRRTNSNTIGQKCRANLNLELLKKFQLLQTVKQNTSTQKTQTEARVQIHTHKKVEFFDASTPGPRRRTAPHPAQQRCGRSTPEAVGGKGLSGNTRRNVSCNAKRMEIIIRASEEGKKYNANRTQRTERQAKDWKVLFLEWFVQKKTFPCTNSENK